MMDVDALESDFDDQPPSRPPAKKKNPVAASKAAKPTTPAKKAPAKSRGKKAVVVSFCFDSCRTLLHFSQSEDDFDDEQSVIEADEIEPPKTAKRTNRTAVLRYRLAPSPLLCALMMFGSLANQPKKQPPKRRHLLPLRSRPR